MLEIYEKKATVSFNLDFKDRTFQDISRYVLV